MLYHYTSQTGLLGILGKHELWASNVHYLNDYREFTFGVDLFCDHIRKERDKAVNGRRRHLDAMLRRIDQQLHPQTPFYVASWSAENDDLAQWRAYSGRGTGYAIGMRGATIARLAEKQRFIFAACVYGPDEHTEWVKQIVETSLNEMIDDESKGIQYHRAVPGDNLLSRLLRFSPLIKHPKFVGEREWRLIDEIRVADCRKARNALQRRSRVIGLSAT